MSSALAPSTATATEDQQPSTTEVSSTTTTVEERSQVPVKDYQGNPSMVAVDADASLLVEYVSSGSPIYAPYMSNRYIQALPNPIDDLMTDFGTKLYESDMFKDPQIYSLMSVLVMGLLAQGLSLTAALEMGDADYAAAVTVLRFCNYVQDNLKGGVPTVLYELAEGMLSMGHKVGEQIYERMKWENQTRTMLTAIKTKPHEATAFVVDLFNNELGLLYVAPGMPLPRLTGVYATSVGMPVPAYPDPITGSYPPGGSQPKMIPRSKFVIPKHKPRNGDPRGTSHMRSAYTAWWKKQQWNPQHLAYVVRWAQPSMYAKLPASTRDLQITKDGKNVRKSIVKATTDVLAAMKGGAVAALIDTDVQLLESKSRAEVIFNSYDHEDRQMAKGLLLQTMTTEESRSMARSASAVHQDVFGLLISFLRWILTKCWREEVLRPLVRYNFGEDAANRFVPTVSLGDTMVHDVPALIGAIAQLSNAKGIHRSQWPKIWPMVSLPEANMDEWQKEQDIIDEQLDRGIMPGAGGPPNQPPAGQHTGNPNGPTADKPGVGQPRGNPPSNGGTS